ncbi:toxin-antitoxin system [Parasulfuritortus cantonensis]|uniref:Toxin-antitoxin system n=1 Tax=Parasulfuritortus cantonensis TaxID=2528202 RepID=A0A4R1B6G8_9PROT|nr:toxin-antitoxin system [Parasulfuritortus cantonensis]TCJ12277.1 toxin-antitoxin system [Parasulfuritortus cantonensis]
MSITTVGVKLDDETRQRLKTVADGLDRTPHWIIKTALAEWLDREEAALKERHEDEVRWARYQESGQAIPQARVMQWLDALATGRNEACPK